MIVSAFDNDYAISDGRDWTQPNENAAVSFTTFRGINLTQVGAKRLKSIKVAGKDLPNFDLQISTDMEHWESIAEVFFDKASDENEFVFDKWYFTFTGYRLLITSREPWLIDKMDFTFE